MGKTRLVAQLRQRAADWPTEVLELQLEFDPSCAPTTASQAWDAFVGLLRVHGSRLFADGGGGLFGGFANDLTAVEQERLLTFGDVKTVVHADDAQIGAGANVGGIEIDLDASGLEGALLAPKVQRAAAAFVSRFARVAKRRAALVTVDGFDAIAGSDYARWVLSLLTQLPNTLVVVVRSPGAAAPGAAGVLPERRRLEPFVRAEVAELLAVGLAPNEPDPLLVDAVHAWSEGHPFTAALAVRYLRLHPGLDADSFATKLAELPPDLTEQRVQLALEIVRAPGAGDLEETARALAVARRFDADLLTALLGPEGLPVPAAEAIERLRQAGLVEQAGDGSYRVPSFVREPLEQGLSPGRRRLLHARAADWYYGLLCADEPTLDDAARAYDDWYRYEKPAWQAQLREWLYHLRDAATTDREREQARARFLRVFLDAFWWWGCYLDFPFCADLVADWRRARDDDAEWVADLQLLLEGYPPGYRKHGAAGWDDVRAALVGVRAACGLDGDPGRLPPDARHTRGLLDNFLAHSVRYRTPAGDAARTRAREQALGYYREAVALFEQGGEAWELAWTLFELAELQAETGSLDDAWAAWQRAAQAALVEDDRELTANLHRLAADLRWAAGAQAAGLDAHGKAVLHAYLFQSRTASRRPDAYTVTFYAEQLERVHERLATLEPSALADAVARLVAPFGTPPPPAAAVAAVLARNDPLALAGLVFPAPPREDELLEVRSAFTRRVDLLAEDLGAECAQDLAGVGP
ncbi:MAG TPA: hypothetical protein VEY87_06620 [Gaiellaceae bacterium]|jgi:hypothetical protein|nr:hypothetical protein [Gaiellaceae bacterium]